METLRREVPSAKWVRPETFHVTLKFIGEYPEGELARLQTALANVGGPCFQLRFRGCGFFTPRSPRVFWAGIEHGPELPALAKAVDHATATVGVARETHPYRPHLTLARFGSGRPEGSARD